MKKKSSHVPPLNSYKIQTTALDEIEKKLSSSSALNGGFETLLFKIDKIEQSQGQLVTKVDKIHDAIYDPNDGIFAKLSEHKLESSEKFSEITQGMNEINVWKKHREKQDVQVEESISRLSSMEKSVESLVKSKEGTWSVFKWFLVAIGGGLITLFFTWIETKIK